ncbi:MAG: hypothetical protein PHR06_11065 [Candidatus Cloacimonetes bacterium]|nr:hypothetical protein [Candidatus Cloacimonadota bacterium]
MNYLIEEIKNVHRLCDEITTERAKQIQAENGITADSLDIPNKEFYKQEKLREMADEAKQKAIQDNDYVHNSNVSRAESALNVFKANFDNYSFRKSSGIDTVKEIAKQHGLSVDEAYKMIDTVASSANTWELVENLNDYNRLLIKRKFAMGLIGNETEPDKKARSIMAEERSEFVKLESVVRQIESQIQNLKYPRALFKGSVGYDMFKLPLGI